MKKYETFNHSKVHIRYHIIFSTKYRKKWLINLEKEVKQIMLDISNKSDFKILNIGIDKNHIHFFIKSNANFSILQIVRRLKQISNRKIWDNYNEILKTYYWKKKKVWTGGYFCSTIGSTNEENIIKYINEQG